jgi:Zn-dependent protease
MSSAMWPVPFFIDPHHLAVDAVISFCVSVLLAITINAEAQAFMATFLGDARSGDSRRFTFNCLLHLSPLGTICYLAGGFGWPRTVDIDPGKFKHPRFYTVITRVTGPLANLMLAGIAGSIVMVMHSVGFDARVFLMVIGVNVTTAVCNLIILPPLAGGVLISALMPRGMDKIRWWFNQSGPYVIVAIILLERIRGELPFRGCLDPLIMSVFNFIKQ